MYGSTPFALTKATNEADKMRELSPIWRVSRAHLGAYGHRSIPGPTDFKVERFLVCANAQTYAETFQLVMAANFLAKPCYSGRHILQSIKLIDYPAGRIDLSLIFAGGILNT